MQFATDEILALLQHADSSFPAGSVSFSSGLETLVQEGLVTHTRFADFLLDTVRDRWNCFDRMYVVRSVAANDDAQRQDLDIDVELSTFGAEARASSRRAGMALLGTWARLSSPAAVHYRQLVLSGSTPGHLPVVQGLIYAEHQLGRPACEAASCWSLLTGLTGAGVRLGLVGHLAAQMAVMHVRPAVAELLAEPVPDDAVPHSWTPVHDIAMSRHALAELRLFAS